MNHVVTRESVHVPQSDIPGREIRTACPEESRHWLAPHVFACNVPEGVVLLDLRSDTYIGIGRRESLVLETVVVNWPKSSPSSAAEYEPAPHDVSCVVADMRSKGLLTTKGVDQALIPQRPVVIGGDLVSVGDELDRPVHASISDILNFISAYVSAQILLRFWPIERVVRGLSKQRLAGAGPAISVDRLVEAVCAFRQLRPYFFTAREHCLLHALALTLFLYRYELFPIWVIGVKTKPWGAHSWVQHENLLLDTNPEKVVEFTPILAL